MLCDLTSSATLVQSFFRRRLDFGLPLRVSWITFGGCKKSYGPSELQSVCKGDATHVHSKLVATDATEESYVLSCECFHVSCFYPSSLACSLLAEISSALFTLTLGSSKSPLFEPAPEGTAVMVPTTMCDLPPPPPTDIMGNIRPTPPPLR